MESFLPKTLPMTVKYVDILILIPYRNVLQPEKRSKPT
jgi:hypothetical protein